MPMDNMNDSDMISRMARIGLIRKVWIPCEERWINYGLLESAWRMDDGLPQYLFRCPSCDLEHTSAMIWDRSDL
jgi:hypothetical protein